MNPLGVILAGGGASRMGRDKALVDVSGRPMVEWVATALGSVTDRLVVLGKSGTLVGIECVPDDHPARRGPLAGLATALRIANGQPVLLVAVDQPWVRSETLAALLDQAGPLHAVVPIDQNARQVTCGIYPGAWAERAAAEDADNGSVQSLLDEVLFHPIEEAEWQAWGEDGRSWFSVDTDADLEEGLSRFGQPGT
jgi:molybdopterin-guanine dinucleotide biosynthesis protein A